MINRGFTLSADVLKVGHHGSNSSTTADFLSRVNPKFAVIMVGKDNTYGHPQRGTMDKLKARGVKVYRTDENGTIIATSDGKNIYFNVKPGSYSYRSGGTTNTGSSTSSKTTTVIQKTGTTTTTSGSSTTTSSRKLYVDANGNGLIKGNISSTGEKIYHLPGGAYYDRTVPEAWFKTEAEAQKAGYRASKR
jgi:competence protein ComEC